MLDKAIFKRENLINYELLPDAISSIDRLAMTVYMALAIILAIIVYGILIIVTFNQIMHLIYYIKN